MAGYGAVGVVVAFVSVLVAGGCTDGGADHLLLDRFFTASRLRNRTALARFSTVIFEPHRDGIVERVTILRSTEPRTVTAATTAVVQPDSDLASTDRSRVVRLSLDLDLDPEPSRSSAPTAVVSREIAAQAGMRRPDGERIERVIHVTVERAERGEPAAKVGRWIVTGFR